MVEIYKGQDKVLHLTLKKAGAVYNLTGLTEATVDFKGIDGALVTKTKSGGGVTVPGSDLTKGLLDVTLGQSDTTALLAGDTEIRVTLAFSAVRDIKIIRNSIRVFDVDVF